MPTTIKIEIEISEADARLYRSMASMGRWCDQVLRLTSEITVGEVVSPELEQLSMYVEEDVTRLKPAISNIHYAIRQKLVEGGVRPLWDQNQG